MQKISIVTRLHSDQIIGLLYIIIILTFALANYCRWRDSSTEGILPPGEMSAEMCLESFAADCYESAP